MIIDGAGAEFEGDAIGGEHERAPKEPTHRRPINREEGVLFDLAERYDVDHTPPISFSEAITLIDAVAEDKEEDPSTAGVLEGPVALKLTKSALIKAREGDEAYQRGEARIARAYFKGKGEYWTETYEDLPPLFADNIRRVYTNVLRQLNERMPVPESILPEPPPEPDFFDIDKILAPLLDTKHARVKQPLKMTDALACFAAYKADIEGQSPPYVGVMAEAIDKAREYFIREDIQPDGRVCVVIIRPDQQTPAIEPYEIGSSYSQHRADGGRQFILDMTDQQRFTNDGEFIHRVSFHERLKESAGRAVTGITRLMENPPQIGKREYTDVTTFLARLGRTEKIDDEIQREEVRALTALVGNKLDNAQIIPQPGPTAN